MSIVNKYIQTCRDINSSKDLSNVTFNFLKENFPGSKISLLLHQPKPNALEVLKTNYKESSEYWFFLLQESHASKISKDAFENNGHLFCFSNTEFLSGPVYIFIIKNHITESTKSVLNAWSSLVALQKSTTLYTEKKTVNDYGNLISQLLHDVQSLMELESENQQNKEILKKLEYQKRLNKNLLFYIRDFDLFKSEINISKLIKDSLSLINLNKDQFCIDFEQPDLEISIDVELFSEAFNQIILNAIEAVDSDFSKLKLKVFSIRLNSPFLNKNWVVFELVDNGKGISDDFMPYVKKPFFTTRKYKSYCGFGLTNAQKIIEGHKGVLEIKSHNGTQVKIIIPQN